MQKTFKYALKFFRDKSILRMTSYKSCSVTEPAYRHMTRK